MERCDSIASQPSTGRLGWFHQIGRLAGNFSLQKAPNLQETFADFPFKRRLTIKAGSSAELDQQAPPAGHPLPFEKGSETLLAETGCREVEGGVTVKPIRELGAASCRRELGPGSAWGCGIMPPPAGLGVDGDCHSVGHADGALQFAVQPAKSNAEVVRAVGG